MRKKNQNLWLGRVTSRLVIKILAQKKKRKKKQHFPKLAHYLTLVRQYYSRLSGIQLINPIIRKKIIQINNCPIFIVLFLLYFTIWHPGLDNRYFPKNKISQKASTFCTPAKIYKVSTIRLSIYLRQSWLCLKCKGTLLISCPVQLSHFLSCGSYRICRIQKRAKEIFALVSSQKQKINETVVLKEQQSKLVHNTLPTVVFEKKFWQSLYPYLHKKNMMIVEP